MPKQIIFISIDGMTDTLGQSQVLPYLTGLAKKGFKITIASCEKTVNFEKNKNTIEEIVNKFGIEWKYCFYKTKIPLLSQRKNFNNLRKLVEKEIEEKGKDTLLHCRSYLPGLIGLNCKDKYGTKFIFDMRGFWADERIDGKIWSLQNPAHKFLYKYFKRKEKQMLNEANYIVTLTEDAKKIVTDWMNPKKISVEVIPCCVDTNHFVIKSNEEKNQIRQKLNIEKTSFVCGYLGSIGTWYMLEEMLDFFVELRKQKNDAIFFFITPDDQQSIKNAASAKNIPASALLIRSAKRNQVPEYISTFNVGLFFIRPSFSKRGSSPTKLAEILACGVPIVTNSGVGDCDAIVTENKAGILIKEFTEQEYNKAADKIDEATSKSPEYYRNISNNNFSLEKGISLYEKIYLSLLDGPK